MTFFLNFVESAFFIRYLPYLLITLSIGVLIFSLRLKNNSLKKLLWIAWIGATVLTFVGIWYHSSISDYGPDGTDKFFGFIGTVMQWIAVGLPTLFLFIWSIGIICLAVRYNRTLPHSILVPHVHSLYIASLLIIALFGLIVYINFNRALVEKIDHITSAEELRDLYKQPSVRYNPYARAALADNEYVPADLKEILRHDSNCSVRRASVTNEELVSQAPELVKDKCFHEPLAMFDETSPETLRLLSKSSDQKALSLVAENWDTPPDVLQELSKKFPTKVANNPHASLETLRELSKSSDYLVQGSVAGNSNTPADVLSALSNNSHDFVLGELAENPNTPPETLDKLAYHSWSGIKDDVISNPSTATSTLIKLTEDKDEEVREWAKRMLEYRKNPQW